MSLTIDYVAPDYSDLSRALGVERVEIANSDVTHAYNGECFKSEEDAVMMACLSLARSLAYHRRQEAPPTSTRLREWVQQVKKGY